MRSFGLIGAPLGAIAGVVLVSAPLNLAELSRETGVSRGHIVATLTPWLWRFTTVAIVAGLTGTWFQPSSLVLLAILGGSAGLFYSLAVVAPLLRSPAGVYLRPLLARAKGVVTGLTARGRDSLSATP